MTNLSSVSLRWLMLGFFSGLMLGLMPTPSAAQTWPRPERSSPSRPPASERYRLGPGDRLKVTVLDDATLSGDYEVLSDGTLVLPLAGTLEVQGLTLEQSTEALTRRFGRLLRRPIVTVSLLAQRPVRVAIAGEVSRPGVYTVGSNGAGSGEKPTLTKLIQQAGGITQTADVRRIEIIREGERGQPGSSRTLDLWQLLQSTDLSQDPFLYDGDRIRIPTAVALKPEEIRSLGSASFAPATIGVNIVGEVPKTGLIQLPPNTPLNQAILAAGGFSNRSEASNVELVRLEPNGTVSRRVFQVDFGTPADEQRNPPLRSNDTVIVARNAFATATDGLGTVLSPFTAGSFLLRIFGLGL